MRTVELRDIGEGWFPGSGRSVLRGRIERQLDADCGGWCVVRLDDPLEVQESGHTTPSGFRLVRYERLLIHPRHVGVTLSPRSEATVNVCLVPLGTDAVAHARGSARIDAWASCRLQDGSLARD